MNTFARTLAPSLRIGYVVLPPPLAKQFEQDFSFYSSSVPCFEQYTLVHFLQEGYFERHLNRMKKTYRQRQKRLTELLRSHPLGAYLHICGEAAGLHLLLEVQLPCTEQELVQAAAAAHVVVYGLSDYYETPQAVPPTPQIVLGYACLSPEELERAVARGFRCMEQQLGETIHLSDGVCGWIARGCGGDVRKAMNTVELIVLSGEHTENGIVISDELAQELTQRSNMRYDRDNDQHYDLLSALQKSIRGSDENAALHYTARLLAANDLLSVCRRLLVIAAEDVGLAYPQAIVITKACVDSALQLGLPEARIPIAEAVVLLATSPKSNSAYEAINRAMADVEEYGAPDFPRHLQNKHFDGAEAAVRGQHYRYPHDYPNHYVRQQYLPDILKDKVYYQFGENRQEQAAAAYREKILREDQT